jgi:hypothetical protein
MKSSSVNQFSGFYYKIKIYYYNLEQSYIYWNNPIITTESEQQSIIVPPLSVQHFQHSVMNRDCG